MGMRVDDLLSLFGKNELSDPFAIAQRMRDQGRANRSQQLPAAMGYRNAVHHMTEGLVNERDSDKDGFLSATEAKLPEQVRVRIDRNSDSKLSVQELDQEFVRLDQNRDLSISTRERRAGYPRIDIFV